MKIAQIAPLYERVPPKQYGGTERIVSYLTEELVRKGHEVTLFASADSVTNARLIGCAPTALRLSPNAVDFLASHVLMLERVFSMASEFDILHFHVDYLHYSLSRREGRPSVTTLHGRLDIPELPALYEEFSEASVISISNSQRKPLPHANWVGTVYHGLPPDLYRPSFVPGSYLVFVGRISPEKRLDRAVEIAVGAGIPLKIAAKVDKADKEYYESEIRDKLNHPLVEYLGELGDKEKGELIAGARALLFPIDWEEPFGLVTIEAMACGTPVIAWPRGSVPEIIENGVNGVMVNTIEAAIEAVKGIHSLDRKRVYNRFQERFQVEQMADNYLSMYRKVLAGRKPSFRIAGS